MKRIILGIVLINILLIVLTGCSNNSKNIITENDNNNVTNNQDEIIENVDESKIEWNEITQNGVDEELLLKNMDIDVLKSVAANLQSAMDEELKEERENPEIVITEGWARIFNKEQYKKVISIGKPAMKPLYWILYKSENNGEYEYICAMALQEISGITFENEQDDSIGWVTAKEYLDLFTKKVISQE